MFDASGKWTRPTTQGIITTPNNNNMIMMMIAMVTLESEKAEMIKLHKCLQGKDSDSFLAFIKYKSSSSLSCCIHFQFNSMHYFISFSLSFLLSYYLYVTLSLSFFYILFQIHSCTSLIMMVDSEDQVEIEFVFFFLASSSKN